MAFQGRGFFDKDLVLECWYDLEVNSGGQYDEEFIDPVAAPATVDLVHVEDDAPAARKRRHVELHTAAFVPLLFAPLVSVVDELPPESRRFFDTSSPAFPPELARAFVADDAPWPTAFVPLSDLTHIEPPAAPADPDRVHVVDDAPWPTPAPVLDSPGFPFGSHTPIPSVVDDAPSTSSRSAIGETTTWFDVGALPSVVDELPTAPVPPVLGDATIPLEASPFAFVVDDAPIPPVAWTLGEETRAEPSLIVPFFEGVWDLVPATLAGPPVDLITVVRPLAPPRPPPSPATAGSGGIAGGGWTRTCSDYVIEPLCETTPTDQVMEDLGADPEPDPSIPARLAGLLGKSATGFAIGKTAAKVAGQHFGKHGAAAASLASVIATAKLTAKIDKKSGAKKMQIPIIAGNVLAAVDDLVELYVPAEQKKQLAKPPQTGTAKLEIVRDPVAFVTRAKELGGEINVSRLQGRDRAGDEVVLLRYSVGGGIPLVLAVYEETLHRGADGQFDARNTLLAAIRKHRR